MNHPNVTYDAHYYQNYCGRPYARTEEWLNFFSTVARKIVQEINPGSVLDAGCAMGFLVEGLRNEQVNAFGLDISEYAISQADPKIQSFLRIGSITDPFPQTYHLIVCIEVLEHLPKADAEKAIANICRFTTDVLFSSTPYDYREVTHFNVQPPEYWAEQFARHGFFRDLDFDASFIAPWSIRFRSRKEPFYRIIQEYDRKGWLLLKENQDLRAHLNEMRAQLSDKESKIALFSRLTGSDSKNLAEGTPDTDLLIAQLATAEKNLTHLKGEIHQLQQQNMLYEEHLADQQKGVLWRFLQKVQSVRLFLIPRGSKRETWWLRLKGKPRSS